MECIVCGSIRVATDKDMCRLCLQDEDGLTISSYWDKTANKGESIIADALDYAERLHGKPEAEIVEKF